MAAMVKMLRRVKKHKYELLMIRIKNRGNIGYNLPAGTTFSSNDYFYVEALRELLILENDICKQQAVDFSTAYKIIKKIESHTEHLKNTPEFKHAKTSIMTADKCYWSYEQYCKQKKEKIHGGYY